MNFWLVIILITIVSVLLLAWILLRKSSANADAQHLRIARNVRLYQQRLSQLKDDLDQQYITQPVYDSLYNELSRSLLNDVEHLQAAPVETSSRRKRLLLLLPAPLLATAIYWSIGAYPDWLITQDLNALADSKTAEEYAQKIDSLHEHLESRLQQRPDHIEYRLLLARYAMSKQDFQQAAVHYGVLVELLPKDADVWGYYAQAEYLRSQRKVTPLVSHAIEQALSLNPFQKTVLGLQGIDAFERGDLHAAIDAWEKLLMVLDDNESAALIRQGINKAKEQLGQDVAVANVKLGVDVSVAADKKLSRLDSSLTVFVYAKAASGPPMPLAVKRMQLKDLPANVHLDDSMAMMPQMKLSQYDEVIIGARISFSGQPVAQKGDWQGETESILWKDADQITVTINQQVQ